MAEATPTDIRPLPIAGPHGSGTAPNLSQLRAEFDRELSIVAPDVLQAAIVHEDEPVFDLGRLLGVSNQEFIRLAYVTLLGRAPDQHGETHIRNSLAQGLTNRIKVLGALRFSDEGAARAIPVPGLKRRLIAERLYGLPIIGRLLRAPGSLLAVPGLIRGIQALADQLASHQALLAQSQEQARLASERHALVNGRLDRLIDAQTREPWIEPILALDARVDRQLDAIVAKTHRLGELNAGIDVIRAIGRTLDLYRQEAGWDEEGDALTRRLIGTFERHRSDMADMQGTLEAQRRELALQRQRGNLLLTELRRLAADQTTGQTTGQTSERIETLANAELDTLYVAFEDVFRGSRDDIKNRQRAYLPVIRDALARSFDRPVVDVGSGRGELLELLGEAGIPARGVDLNAAMTALCSDRGLDCIHGDAVAHLAGLEPATLGAVTGFHIVEHLPFTVLVALLDQSLRALASGGLVLFETPNPANLLTSSRWFYLDPTHRNPIPAEMLAMIAEARGFVDVEIREVNPSPLRFAAQDQHLGEQLDRIFHGPQDYALIARKP